MQHVMKIVKSPEYSGLLLKEVTKAIENERKRERDATQGASLLGNLLSGESIVHAVGEVIRAVNGTKAKKKTGKNFNSNLFFGLSSNA